MKLSSIISLLGVVASATAWQSQAVVAAVDDKLAVPGDNTLLVRPALVTHIF
jgi:hypothetical protein